MVSLCKTGRSEAVFPHAPAVAKGQGNALLLSEEALFPSDVKHGAVSTEENGSEAGVASHPVDRGRRRRRVQALQSGVGDPKRAAAARRNRR